MFIITDDSNTIKYVSEIAPEICEDRIKFPHVHDCTLNAGNCTVVETAVAIPGDWTGNKYLWVDGGFVLNPEFKDSNA